MKRKAYTSKGGETLYKPIMSLKTLDGLMFDSGNNGWCLACGTVVSGCEPDMRRGMCECCGANRVYGFEELALRNLISCK
jgi:hypothetical protein